MISSYPTVHCGVSRYTRELISGLRNNHIEVFTYRMFFYYEWFSYFLIWPRLFLGILRIKPDILHIQYTPTICGPFLPTLIAFIRASKPKTRIVITAHEKPSVYLKKFPRVVGYLFRLYEKSIYIMADKILVHTSEHKQELTNKYRISDAHVLVIPFGINEARKVDAGQVQDIRREYALDGKQVVTFFGTIRANKGIEYLIQSFSAVIKNKDNMGLLIAGGALKAWSGYLDGLKLMVDKLDMKEHVKFTGFIEEADIPAIMNTSKIIVLPYTDITQSAVLYQDALAYARPVIVTDVGDLGRVVEQNHIGLVVPPRDIDSLNEAIVNLVSNEQKLRVCQDNEIRMQREFSWDSISKLHARIYDNTLLPLCS
jgi:glycosyltransferase involved in cell wall biosynthesis